MANFQSKNYSSRAGLIQAVHFTGTAGSSAAFGTSTYQIRLAPDSAVNVLIFSSTDAVSVATSNVGFYMSDSTMEYFTVSPGQRVSVLPAATDGEITSAAGTLWVMEVS